MTPTRLRDVAALEAFLNDLLLPFGGIDLRAVSCSCCLLLEAPNHTQSGSLAWAGALQGIGRIR